VSRPTDAREDAAVAALISEWNLHEPDARRMVRIVLRSADAHTFPEKLTTSPEHVQIPAESEHVVPFDRCPTCAAHMPVGQTCGGVNCGLRRKDATE